MVHPQAGLVERWSGRILRYLMSFLAGVGVAVAVLVGVPNLSPEAIGYGLILAVPYLIIRYRDPDSSTVPLEAAVR